MYRVLVCIFLICFMISACKEDEPPIVESAQNSAPGQQETAAAGSANRLEENINAREPGKDITLPDSIDAEPKQEVLETFPAEESLGEEEKKKADRALEFHNSSRNIFATGYYSLADTLNLLALYYRENWSLPGRPKIGSRKRDHDMLVPPKGIFDEAEEKNLNLALLDMDKKLESMLADYKDLARYVQDDSIRDNGRQGIAMSKKLMDGHADFMAARRTWLDIVEYRAAAAEAALLRGHPLRRQITGATTIFNTMDKVEDFLKLEKPDRQILADLCQNMLDELKNAEKPPFPAAPGIERLFRQYLKTVGEYIKIYRRGLDEGFHGIQKKELAQAANQCRESYDAFAREVNLRAAGI